MSEKLIDFVTRKLLEKFGAGNHKPGSGSASAFQGMISAQMLRTVIDLTTEAKRKHYYEKHLTALGKLKHEIETRIYPSLEELFQKDSDQFDKVIQLRGQRDAEKNYILRRHFMEQERKALKLATEIPLQIADYCLELGDFAASVFDIGFQSARGDSGVALNTAISGVGSCLFIVELNLKSFLLDDWTEQARQHKRNVKTSFDKLRLVADEKLAILEKESEENIIFHDNITYFSNGNLADSIRSDSDIEEIVRRLQNTLWTFRTKIWKHDTPDNPLLVLKPEIVLKKIMDYHYDETDSLGMHMIDGDMFEIAGLIDKNKKLVQVSQKFALESRRFTAAHELGHAIFHKQVVLHRDKINRWIFSSKKS
jgi:formiminotetrahydrofolate cyclodeaminase